MTPCREEIAQPVSRYLRVQAAHKLWLLRSNAPGAVACIALLAYPASHGNERCCADDACVCAECYSLNNVRALPDTASDKDGCAVAYALLPEPFINCCKSKLDGNPDMVSNNHGCRSRTSAEAVYHHYVRPGAHDAASYCSHVMHSRDLDRHG